MFIQEIAWEGDKLNNIFYIISYVYKEREWEYLVLFMQFVRFVSSCLFGVLCSLFSGVMCALLLTRIVLTKLI